MESAVSYGSKNRCGGALPLLVALMIGCSDDPTAPEHTTADGGAVQPDAGNSTSDGEDAGAAPADGDDGGTAVAPLYAVTTQVLGDVPVSYVALVSDLSASETADTGDALEVPGRALAVGPNGAGYVLVASSEAPTLTRYDIAAGGEFKEGATLSFANLGVASLLAFAQQFVFVSPTKAYFLDDTSDARLLVFNPEEMTLTGSVPLDGIVRDGWSFTYGLSAKLRGDQLVFTASYYDDESGAFDAETRLIVVDTGTDSVVSVTPESRCGYLLHSIVGADGTLYFGSNVYTSVVEEVLGDAFGGPSCVLRLPEGATAFDDDYLFDLQAAAAENVVGSLIAGSDGRVYTRVLSRELLPSDADFVEPGALSNGPYFYWAEVDLGTSVFSEVLSDLGAGAAQSVEYPVEGRSFIGQSSADFATTTLIDFGEDPPREGMKFPGIPFSIVRVR
jgi:hypothetical protein